MDELEKKIPVLCLGPKGSGKTTLLKKLQKAEGIDNTYSPVPTIGTNIYDVYYTNKHGKKQMLSIREVGGEMAPLWHNYLDGVEKVRRIKINCFNSSPFCCAMDSFIATRSHDDSRTATTLTESFSKQS